MNEEGSWIEKYRPETLDDIIGQDANVKVLKNYAENARGEIPHFIFAGPTGNGKTTSAFCFAKALFGENWRNNFIEFNASDERGIDTVRNEIKTTSQQVPAMGDFQLLFLDEADALTDSAQDALRRPIENTSQHTKFIFSCNHPSQIIDPIKGRCQNLRYAPVEDEDIYQNLKMIADSEGLDYDDKALRVIASKSMGKVRDSIGSLQQIAVANNGDIKTKYVKRHLDPITRDEIDEMFGILMQEGSRKDKIKSIDERIYRMYYKGMDAREILTKIYDYMVEKHPNKVSTMVKIGDIDAYISEGANPLLQLRCFMAHLVKELS